MAKMVKYVIKLKDKQYWPMTNLDPVRFLATAQDNFVCTEM